MKSAGEVSLAIVGEAASISLALGVDVPLLNPGTARGLRPGDTYELELLLST